MVLVVCNLFVCCVAQVALVKEITDLNRSYLVKYGLNRKNILNILNLCPECYYCPKL